MKNADAPAYPLSVSISDTGDVVTSADIESGYGLTKLEAFTIAAMQGLMANPYVYWHNGEAYFANPDHPTAHISVARAAIEQAKKQVHELAELSKSEGGE